MIGVTHKGLKNLAAITWYTGSVILFIKGTSLLQEAYALTSTPATAWMPAVTGLLLGGLKARLIFIKSCKNNLNRIDDLPTPKPWQFFRPIFFLFLALMITIGGALSTMAHGNYPMLIAVGILDLSIASALLISSYVFWKKNI